jgi:hypothetical protein
MRTRLPASARKSPEVEVIVVGARRLYAGGVTVIAMSPTSGTDDTVAPFHGRAGAISSCRQPPPTSPGANAASAPASASVPASAAIARRTGARSTSVRRSTSRSRVAVERTSASTSAVERTAPSSVRRCSSTAESRSDATGLARAPIHRAIAASSA